jgi:hypothetical protein
MLAAGALVGCQGSGHSGGFIASRSGPSELAQGWGKMRNKDQARQASVATMDTVNGLRGGSGPAAPGKTAAAAVPVSHQTTEPALRIDAVQVKAALEAGEPVAFLDVRWPAAWQAASEKIVGALHFPGPEFKADPAWPRDQLTVLYCT